ncbi:uncharacterized protein ISCGN_006278, partial [Ixodes scapularis]
SVATTSSTVPQGCAAGGLPDDDDEPSGGMDEEEPAVNDIEASGGIGNTAHAAAPAEQAGLVAVSHPTSETVGQNEPPVVIEQNVLLRKRIAELERDLELEKKRNDQLNLQLNKEHWINEDLIKKCSEMSSQALNLENIKVGKHFMFYTGLPNYGQFQNLCRLVVATYPSICKGNYMRAQKPEDQLFMVLVRLRTAMPCKELARNFGLSESTLSRTFSQWVFMLDSVLRGITRFPHLHEVQRYLPECFREFPDTRLVLDCTEIRIQKPSALEAQRKTFSSYKHANTMKCLVGMTPDCNITFVSDLYGGSTSDRAIVQKCGVLSMLESGDAVMVDKGFKVQDLLPVGVKLYIPPFRIAGEKQMRRSDVVCTRKVARARVHVERAIRRIKEFHIFDTPLPLNMADIADKIITTCALLSNFHGPLIRGAE